jgi:hypothetical protein
MLPYIHMFVEGWRSLECNDFIVNETVGITNKTFILESTKGVSPKRIIFRHFGRSCEGIFLDRERESGVLKRLGELGIGPGVYG